jgi:hypothetical protein
MPNESADFLGIFNSGFADGSLGQRCAGWWKMNYVILPEVCAPRILNTSKLRFLRIGGHIVRVWTLVLRGHEDHDGFYEWSGTESFTRDLIDHSCESNGGGVSLGPLQSPPSGHPYPESDGQRYRW